MKFISVVVQAGVERLLDQPSVSANPGILDFEKKKPLARRISSTGSQNDY